jgi:hypothetical protein
MHPQVRQKLYELLRTQEGEINFMYLVLSVNPHRGRRLVTVGIGCMIDPMPDDVTRRRRLAVPAGVLKKRCALAKRVGKDGPDPPLLKNQEKETGSGFLKLPCEVHISRKSRMARSRASLG